MDQRQVDLADKFINEVAIFYSRQEGIFENLSDDEKEQIGIEDNKAILIKTACVDALAAQGDVYNMGRLPDVFNSQALYKKGFRLSYDNVSARSIVLAYKIGLMIGRQYCACRKVARRFINRQCQKPGILFWRFSFKVSLTTKLANKLELYGASL